MLHTAGGAPRENIHPSVGAADAGIVRFEAALRLDGAQRLLLLRQGARELANRLRHCRL